MEDSVGSTIEKIKLEEQNKEAQLKEKRELEATVAFMNRAVREATAQAEKSKLEQEELIRRTDSLRKLEIIEEVRRDALSFQLNSLTTQLKELRAKSDAEISKVWQLRSSFCEEMHLASDDYDVWTLLMKPACLESMSRNTQKKTSIPNTVSENENRLQVAIERRLKTLAERDRLAKEPDNDEQFIRIKNTLQYSLEKIAELQLKNNHIR